MSWNHRVLAHETNDEVYFQIHEVYYDKDGNPDGYAEDGTTVGGESIESISWVLEEMTKCLKKPILSVNNFPKEYERKESA
jgi:hypothetical protein